MGTAKRNVYQDVTASKVITRDGKHFASYILVPNLGDAIYIKGTPQIHRLERVGKSKVNIYHNSTCKKSSSLLRAVDYVLASTPDSYLEELGKPSENEKDEPFTEAVDQHNALEVTIGNIVVVL